MTKHPATKKQTPVVALSAALPGQNNKKDWTQLNYRTPRNFKTGLRTLAAASGLDIEDLGTEALAVFFGLDPIDPDRMKLIRRKMKEVNIHALLNSTFTRYGLGGDRMDFSAVSSVVEHVLHTDGVAGSKPAPRTTPQIIFQVGIKSANNLPHHNGSKPAVVPMPAMPLSGNDPEPSRFRSHGH